MKLPRHACGLYLEHNSHKDVYETVAQAVAREENNHHWVSPEERQRAIDTNEMWSLQWYPDTPIGFHRLQASTWEAIEARLGDYE